MSTQIAVRIPEAEVAALDEAVSAGHYETRADAVRAGVRLLLRQQREAEIAGVYREAYSRHPDDPTVGEAGARLAAETAGR